MNEVLQVLQGTIQADPGIRNNAEKQLKAMEKYPGFLSSLLQISQSNDKQIAQAATIYFKNRVKSGWDERQDQQCLQPEEKQWVKSNILQAIANATPNQRSIFLASISFMISNEFYENSWPELVHHVSALIHSANSSMVMTGVLVLLEIVKYYQWTPANKRVLLNGIVDSLYPKLLMIAIEAEKLQGNLDALFMLKTIMKTYSCSIRMEMPKSLQQSESIVRWATLFLSIVNRNWTPEVIELPMDDNEREKHMYWKCKKWAFGCLNSIMGRYARARRKDKNYAAFSKLFMDQFVPKILDSYLIQISNYTNGTWTSKRVQQALLTFLEHCVKPKSTWTVLSTHLEPIITKFVFPLLSFTDADEELWNEDPVEYIHKKVDPPIDDFRSPVTAAHELLVVIAETRFAEAFVPIITMVNTILTNLAQNPNPRLKFGALNMMSYLADLALSEKSPIKGQMEQFMRTYVFQELVSPHSYLRAKACDVITRFAKLIYAEEQNLHYAFQNILNLISDNELPVRVSASLAIASFLKYPVVIQAMKPHVVQVMQSLMNTTNEIDLDTLTNSMELLVFEFSEDLKPFATQLATQLVYDVYVARYVYENHG
jgi:hypothetical protein